ncbi:MAG: ferredoxin [Pseudomonadota bacterium]
MAGAPAALAAIDAALAPHGLAVTGAFHPGAEDGAPAGTGTLCLVGATGPAMWAAFRASAEFGDGAAHPLDRWSARVIGGAAETLTAAGLEAAALFPFGGPPYQPFMRWAPRAEGARPSPIGMFVTAGRGLWSSWRGALAFPARIALDALTGAPFADPCLGCPAPCAVACPVDAFATGHYDVPACIGHITTAAGTDCRVSGCLARRACPAGPAAEAILGPGQAASHLAAFCWAHGGA